MSKHCELTGKGPTTGNLVSHSNIKTRTRWLPNLVSKRYTIDSLGQVLRLKLSTHAVRTIDKQGGIVNAILKAKDAGLSPRLQAAKRKILAQRSKATAPKASK